MRAVVHAAVLIAIAAGLLAAPAVAAKALPALAFVRRYGWRFPSILDPRRVRARRLGAEYHRS